MDRSESLQDFLDASFVAFDRFANDIRSRDSISQIFALLDMPGTERTTPGKRLPVCERFLDAALAIHTDEPSLKAVITQFKAIEPMLEWKSRATPDNSGSDNFSTSHANAMIIGPGGFEERNDLWLGVSLLAPHVRYPDHNHSPEETYLVMSEGEFRQADNEWFSPGLGGSFYNPPDIKHAMRSGETPLLAFWALLADQAHH